MSAHADTGQGQGAAGRAEGAGMAREPLFKQARTAVIAVVLFTLLLGVAYPLAVTGIGQALFPHQANGSQIRLHGRLIGSSLIGQRFVSPRYFQGRPSATTPPDNAAATTFSNLGPNSRATEEGDAQRIKEYLALNRLYDPSLTVAEIPVDAVNTSASGVDPEISVANADIQAHRVAAVRHMPLAHVMALIARHTNERMLGFLGEPGVNVLELNLALDRASRGVGR